MIFTSPWKKLLDFICAEIDSADLIVFAFAELPV